MNLIFDLDGTLLYTLEDLKNSVNFALKNFNYPTKSLDEVRNSVGNGLKMLVFRSLPNGTDESTVEDVLLQMKSFYAEHCHNKTVPYDGVVEMLSRLKADGHHIAIVSNKADSMVQTLKNVYFGNLVDFAIGESDINHRKPAPDMVFAAMDALESDAIYIGDSEVDIETAKNANIPCFSVSWGYRSTEDLKAAGAKQLYDSPLALLDAIRNFNNN